MERRKCLWVKKQGPSRTAVSVPFPNLPTQGVSSNYPLFGPRLPKWLHQTPAASHVLGQPRHGPWRAGVARCRAFWDVTLVGVIGSKADIKWQLFCSFPFCHGSFWD